MRPGFAVVIPALDASRTIRRCLDAVLLALGRWGVGQVTVVDNGSTDGTFEIVGSEYGDRVRPLRIPQVTIAALRNTGARLTAGELLSFVDSDCAVTPEYYDRAWTALEQSGADATGAAYSLPERAHWIERTWQALHESNREGPVPWLYGGNLVVRRSAFEQVGGFAEALVTGEDVEFCERLRSRGHRIHQDPRVGAVHFGNPRSLPGFCKQQLWHGLGMWRTARGMDKPLLMTILHALASLGAIVWAWAVGASTLTALAILSLAQLPVPAATVAFRVAQTGRRGNPLRGTLLYWLYYWCRAMALVIAPVAARRPHLFRGR